MASITSNAAALPDPNDLKKTDGRIPVTVLTGFLGSGKTTLLNHILTARHGWKIAIIENEFGEVGIDDALLRSNMKEHTEEEVIEMLNGCVCCTVRNDLIDTLQKIVRNSSVMKKGGYTLDAVVIETTGMADPAPVAQTFFVDEEIQKYYKLDGIVTLVDAKHIEQHLDEEKPEGAENESVEQVAFADRVILNKIDLVPEEEDLQRVEARIRAINGFAQIVRADHSAVDVTNVLNLGAFDLQRTLDMDPEFLNMDGEHVHDESVSSTGVDIVGDVDLDMFQDYMSSILQEQGSNMFRMKGVLAAEGVPDKFVYQAVHMIFKSNFAESWAEGETRCCKLTFIGKDIDKEALREGFIKCLATPENLPERLGRMRAKREAALAMQKGKLLLAAAQQNNVAALQEQIDAGTDPCFGNPVGQTALHVAVLWGNVDAAQFLVAAGANVNQRNDLGAGTPLHTLARSSKPFEGRLACARILIDAGANPLMKDASDRTALDMAEETNDTEIAAYLTGAMAAAEGK